MSSIMNIDILARYADFIAAPLFLLASYYFFNIQNKNIIEYLLLLFSVSALFIDIFFSVHFLYKNKILF